MELALVHGGVELALVAKQALRWMGWRERSGGLLGDQAVAVTLRDAVHAAVGFDAWHVAGRRHRMA